MEVLELSTMKSGRIIIMTMLLMLIGIVELRAQSEKITEIDQLLNKLNKPVVKTIENADGDIIDCIDIYKQPAFDHPLLKNHTIEMRSSFFSEMGEMSYNHSSNDSRKVWRPSIRCPKGTVPIRRVTQGDLLLTKSLGDFRRMLPYAPTTGRLELASVRMVCHEPLLCYNGVSAELSVWSPFVERFEGSFSMVGVVDGENTITAGWGIVWNTPRVITSWGAPGGRGCFNVHCPGFVQVNNMDVLGSTLPVSTTNGQLSMLRVQIIKDHYHPQRWWLRINDMEVGYWPTTLFWGLRTARLVVWSGSVVNTMNFGHHAITQMGSGKFAEEGYGRAAHFERMRYIDAHGRERPAHDLDEVVDFPHCYNLVQAPRHSNVPEPVIFFGGPGGEHCDRRPA